MQHIPRLFVENDLFSQAELQLSREQSQYLSKVMRQRIGAHVRIFNGRDGEWQGQITDIGRHHVVLVTTAQLKEQTICPDIELVFAPIKRARLECIVEKSTELGVRHLALVRTEYTQQKSTRFERLQTIIREAAEQTERLDLPSLAAETPLAHWLQTRDSNRTLIFCDESGTDTGTGTTPIHAAICALPAASSLTILIGPEGGFSPTEQAHIKTIAGTIPVSLGPRILRADTAAIAALSIIQARIGDWYRRQ